MTEVEKLIKALQAGAKTKSELEPRLHFRSVVKNVVDRARKKGFTITYSEGQYSLQNHDSTIQV